MKNNEQVNKREREREKCKESEMVILLRTSKFVNKFI
jgi:hypothetical protein